MNPLARDRSVMTEFCERVERGETEPALRLARALGIVAESPPFFETDEAYLERLVRTYVPSRRRRRTDRMQPAAGVAA
jgi:hypothetical protein